MSSDSPANPPVLYVLDGSYYVFRAFYAVSGMTNGRGLPTNGLFAFTGMLLNVIRDHRPDYLVVTFDPPGDTFRNEMYPAYKANRGEPPEDLVPQFPWFRRIVEALSIPVLEIPGFEADDCIGTLVARGERQGMRVVVLSGDKDLAQLVDEHTTIVDSMRDKVMDLAAVRARFQVEPAQVADVLGLAGDTSDNIPGVPGIGEKTAGQLIAQFGSLEALLERVGEVTGPKRRESLVTFADQARLSKALATIRRDVPIRVDLDEFRLTAPDFDAFDAVCTELNFGRFRDTARDLFREEVAQAVLTRTEANTYRMVLEESDLDACIAQIRASGRLSFDLETTSVDPLEAEIVGFALAWAPGDAVYVPVGHRDLTAPRQLPLQLVLDRLAPLLQDPAIAKIGQHTKYEHAVLDRYRVRMVGVTFDTMLAGYLLDPNLRRYGLDSLAQQWLKHRNIAFSEVAGTGAHQKNFADVDVESATAYAAEDADVTLRLADAMAPAVLDAGLQDLLVNLEVPLSRVLATMEGTGIRLDVPYLATLSHEFAARIDDLEQQIYEEAGGSFTIGSPKQLGTILFERLGLPTGKKTKTGYSTDQSVLEELQHLHPVVALILQYRQITKLASTYVDALPKLVRPQTGRLHTDFNQAVAATGRLSSSNPNLQNIPIRTAEGRRIRQAFLPAEGWVLFGGDYSQIELRVLAHMSGDPVLIDAFQRGDDIHRRTAAEVFGVPVGEVTATQRAAAKTINFGVIYGMGANRLADGLDITRDQAKHFIEQYFARIEGVKPFFERLIAEARETSAARTMLGRLRPIPELQSRSPRDQALGERLAINTPIQGTAADLIKLAMVKIDRELTAAGLQTRMLLQVHDELVFECPPEEQETAMTLVREAMESAISLRVPLRVDLAAGPNWAALK